MNRPTLIAIARLEYTLVTAPFRLLEGAAAKYGRRDLADTLARGLDTLDSAVATLLKNGTHNGPPSSDPKPSAGSTDGPRADTAPPAASPTRTEPRPRPARAPAAPTLTVVEDGAGDTDDTEGADDLEVERERVVEELLEEQESTPLVGELADADDDERHRQAELRAKHLVEEYEEEKRLRHERLESGE